MRFGPFELRPARSIGRRVVGFLALAIGVPAAILFCCVCGPIIGFFVESDLERAEKLWSAGKQAEAVELYSVALPNATRPNALALKRTIEWHWTHEDQAQAIRFCELAAEKEIKLSLTPEELHERYEEARRRFERSEEKRAAEEARLRQARSAESTADVDYVGAWIAAQRYVEGRIERGAVADFGDVGRDYQNPEDNVRSIGKDRFRAVGWVDVTDAAGETVRSDFEVDLKWDRFDRSWSLDGEPLLIPRDPPNVDQASAAEQGGQESPPDADSTTTIK
jgi:hypothetical protein